MFELGSGSGIKIHQDPFNKNSFDKSCIFIGYGRTPQGTPAYSSWIEFKNGDTSGKQEFKASSLPELLAKMETFMNSLQ